MNKLIKIKDFPDFDFDRIFDDPDEVIHDELSTKFIFDIRSKWFPEFPGEFGFWETEWFETDALITTEFPPYDDIEFIYRVEPAIEIVERKIWKRCE